MNEVGKVGLAGDTHAYILTDCVEGNPAAAPGVGGIVFLVTVESC